MSAVGLPYGPTSQLLWWLSAPPPIQALALRRLRRKYPDHPLFSGDVPPHREAVRRHLHHMFFRNWREDALDRCSDATFARWTNFAGTEHLEAARAEGRGLILAGSHYAAGQTLKIVLTRFGIDLLSTGVARGGRPRGPWRHGNVHWITARCDDTHLLRALVELRKRVLRGGAVHLAADSTVGRSGVRVDFFGRSRRFGRGFAVLASTTGAPVVPVFAALAAGGRVEVEFLPPLAPPSRDLPREERLGRMVQEYATRLEEKWRADVALIVPGGPAARGAPRLGERKISARRRDREGDRGCLPT